MLVITSTRRRRPSWWSSRTSRRRSCASSNSQLALVVLATITTGMIIRIKGVSCFGMIPERILSPTTSSFIMTTQPSSSSSSRRRRQHDLVFLKEDRRGFHNHNPNNIMTSSISSLSLLSKDDENDNSVSHSSTLAPPRRSTAQTRNRQGQRQKTQRRRNLSKSQQNALIRVIDSIIYDAPDNNEYDNENDEVLLLLLRQLKPWLLQVKRSCHSYYHLQHCATTMAPPKITSSTLLDNPTRTMVVVMEKYIRILALMGTPSTTNMAIQHFQDLLSVTSAPQKTNNNYYYMPPSQTYGAVLTALRQESQWKSISVCWEQLVERARIMTTTGGGAGNGSVVTRLDTYAWNIYLAALCEQHDGDDASSSLQQACDELLYMTYHHGRDHPPHPHHSRYKLTMTTAATMKFTPDIFSYNTILHAAAKAGNTTMVDQVWKALVDATNHDVQPDIRSYNARLLAAEKRRQQQQPQGGNHNNHDHNRNDYYSQHWKIWKELNLQPNIRPDRYTIDFMLLPLLLSSTSSSLDDDIEDNEEETTTTTTTGEATLTEVLNDYVQRELSSKKNNHPGVLGDALASFLSTLVANGKVQEAQTYIWDPYVLPCFKIMTSYQNNNNSSRAPLDDYRDPAAWVQTKHFNILMEGHRQQAIQLEQRISAFGVRLTYNNCDDDDQYYAKDGGKDDDLVGVISMEDQRRIQIPAQLEHWAEQEEQHRQQGRALYHLLMENSIKEDGDGSGRLMPDAYTLTTMLGLCESSDELVSIMTDKRLATTSLLSAPPVLRAVITNAGRLGDATLACALYDEADRQRCNTSSNHMSYGHRDRSHEDPTNPRLWNVLLGALEDCAEANNCLIQDLSEATALFRHHVNSEASGRSENCDSIVSLLLGKTCTGAVQEILNVMKERKVLSNPQTYCVAAAALQYDANAGPDLAMDLFRNATIQSVPADGRFINAILRCFGTEIKPAINFWKSDLRPACLAYESQPRPYSSPRRPTNKNLIAAYNGLMHVCGRAERPDVGVRVCYAMNREEIEPNDITLNNYHAGKRLSQKAKNEEPATPQSRSKRFLASLSQLTGSKQQYESLLYVECTKYNQYSKRMSKDRRVRIIV